MKLAIKKLLVLTMILNVPIASCLNGWASEPRPSPSPRINLTPAETQIVIETLQACDSALSNCAHANESKQHVIKKQDELLANQSKEIEQLKSPSLLRNPLVWFILGIGATIGIQEIQK